MTCRIAAAALLAAIASLAGPSVAAFADGEVRPAAVPFAGTNLPINEVFAKAKPDRRLVVIDVITEHCTWCRALERDTFGAPEVAKALVGCVAARYDAGQDGGREVAERYRVRAYPTVVFTDADGLELDRVVGYLPPARFAAETDRIRRGVGTLPALAAAHAKDPSSLVASAAYGRKLVRAGELAAAEPLLRSVIDAAPANADAADADTRPSALEGLAELALCRFDTRGALGWYARITDEHPSSDAAADAWIARVQIRAREGAVAAALAEVARARELVKDPEKVMVLEQLAFRLHRQEMEAALVRWGEKADLAKDAESLNAAARAALDAHIALGTATRWAEHAVELSRRDPSVLDTLARLLFEEGDLAQALGLESEAVAQTKDPEARAALAAELKRIETAFHAPALPAAPLTVPVPVPLSPSAVPPDGASTPAAPAGMPEPPAPPGPDGAPGSDCTPRAPVVPRTGPCR